MSEAAEVLGTKWSVAREAVTSANLPTVPSKQGVRIEREAVRRLAAAVVYASELETNSGLGLRLIRRLLRAADVRRLHGGWDRVQAFGALRDRIGVDGPLPSVPDERVARTARR